MLKSLLLSKKASGTIVPDATTKKISKIKVNIPICNETPILSVAKIVNYLNLRLFPFPVFLFSKAKTVL